LFRHPVRFLFVFVVGLADLELCLESTGRKKPLDCLIAKCPLELQYVLCGGVGGEKLAGSLGVS
jgi:hypothetical protein